MEEDIRDNLTAKPLRDCSVTHEIARKKLSLDSNMEEIFQLGQHVEVLQRTIPLKGSWRPATITMVKPGRREVLYDDSNVRESLSLKSLVTASKTDGIKQHDTKSRGFLRPIPPQLHLKNYGCHKGLFVDAFMSSAWWEGVLLEYIDWDKHEIGTVKILFPCRKLECNVHVRDLRVSLEWSETTGRWTVRGLCKSIEKLCYSIIPNQKKPNDKCVAKANAKNSMNPNSQIVKEKLIEAKNYLLSQGYKVEYHHRVGRSRELVYISPSGRRFYSLTMACKTWKRQHGLVCDHSPCETKQQKLLCIYNIFGRSPCLSKASLGEKCRYSEQPTHEKEVSESESTGSELTVSECLNSEETVIGSEESPPNSEETVSDSEECPHRVQRNRIGLVPQQSSCYDVDNVGNCLLGSGPQGFNYYCVSPQKMKSRKRKNDQESRNHRNSQKSRKHKTYQESRNHNDDQIFAQFSGLEDFTLRPSLQVENCNDSVFQKKKLKECYQSSSPELTMAGYSVISQRSDTSKTRKDVLNIRERNSAITKNKSHFQDTFSAITDESHAIRTHSVEEGMKTDDLCSICGDAGSLIICDNCPSAYHKECVGLDVTPEGNWYCFTCCCKVCRKFIFAKACPTPPPKCCQCSNKYHRTCSPSGVTMQIATQMMWFCSHSCKRIFAGLNKLVNIDHPLGLGDLSWALLKSTDELNCVPVLQSSNRKIMAAHNVLHECFLPIVDECTGLDKISQVLFNRGSQFVRLDCGNFYTVALESKHEIISVATIRVHGEALAELPFIGTRLSHRRRGMCRLLIGVIEKMLSEFGVRKLILPAVHQLLNTWIEKFNFHYINNMDKKEMMAVNILRFPGTKLLKKYIMGAKITEITKTNKDMGSHCTKQKNNGSFKKCGSKRLQKCKSNLKEMPNSDSDDGRVILTQTINKRLVKTSKWYADSIRAMKKNVQKKARSKSMLGYGHYPQEVGNCSASSCENTDGLDTIHRMSLEEIEHVRNTVMGVGDLSIGLKCYTRRRKSQHNSCTDLVVSVVTSNKIS